jgi:hypothetical protein
MLMFVKRKNNFLIDFIIFSTACKALRKPLLFNEIVILFLQFFLIKTQKLK